MVSEEGGFEDGQIFMTVNSKKNTPSCSTHLVNENIKTKFGLFSFLISYIYLHVYQVVFLYTLEMRGGKCLSEIYLGLVNIK